MSLSLWFEKLYVTIITYIPLSTLGLCAAIALALFSLSFLVHLIFKKTDSFNAVRFLSLSCLIAWIYFILEVTLLSRFHFDTSNFGLNLNLFTPNPEGMFSTVITALYNALMFALPALLLPFISKAFKRFYITLPLCILFGIAVEASQLYFKVGMCELDDVVYYTMGAVLGFLLHPVVSRLIFKKPKSTKTKS